MTATGMLLACYLLVVSLVEACLSAARGTVAAGGEAPMSNAARLATWLSRVWLLLAIAAGVLLAPRIWDLLT